jgi:mono/diheme cytochrome c family protein
MPGFADVLTLREIRDVSAYVVEVLARPIPLDGETAPLPDVATTRAELRAPGGVDPEPGRLVYEDRCAGCHAPDGSGGPLAPPLSAHPVAFDDLVDLIVGGNVQHGMPGYQRILGANQIEQVAAYVNEILLKGVRPQARDREVAATDSNPKG